MLASKNGHLKTIKLLIKQDKIDLNAREYAYLF